MADLRNFCIIKTDVNKTTGNPGVASGIFKPCRLRREASMVSRTLTVVNFLGPAAIAHPFDHTIGLVLAKITAKTNMINTDQFHRTSNHLTKVFKRAGRPII